MKNGFGLITKIGETFGILFMLNMLWVVTTVLGLGLTLGAATTACYGVMKKRLLNEDEVMLHNCVILYYRDLKENFKNSTIVWIVSVAVFLMVVFNIKFSIVGYGEFGFVLQGLQIIVLIQLIFINIHCYSLISTFNAKLHKIIYSSLLISNAHLFTTLTCIAIAMGLIFTLNTFNYLTVFIIVSSYIGITAFLFKPIYAKYAIKY